MEQMLPDGARIKCKNLSAPLEVKRLLGSGGQGEVYEVLLSGEAMAAKWYSPNIVARDKGLPNRLRECIQTTSPNESFLWPNCLLELTDQSRAEMNIPEGSFGYLMRLRPNGFVGALDHCLGKVSMPIRCIVRACFQLSEAFEQLHSKGLCYKDISLGNVFLHPDRGDILICDNDNVEENGKNSGLAVGTSGFMAPEVLLGHAKPSAESDLYSLAVLMFYLLTRSDPLKGAMELQIRCLDDPARYRIYGEDPVFIFDPQDDRNRPDPEVHTAAVIAWPIYPRGLQQLFEKTFGAGMKNSSARILTGQWCEALADCLDHRQICPHCGQEVFATAGAGVDCWDCGRKIEASTRLNTGHRTVFAQPDNELYPHHFNAFAAERLDTPIARVRSHPRDPSILGLKNLSNVLWTAVCTNGESIEIPPGKSCSLNKVSNIRTNYGVVALE